MKIVDISNGELGSPVAVELAAELKESCLKVLRHIIANGHGNGLSEGIKAVALGYGNKLPAGMMVVIAQLANHAFIELVKEIEDAKSSN